MGIDELVKLIKKFLSKKISNKIFITGGIVPKILKKDLKIKTGLTEADTFLNALELSCYKNLKVFVERKSINTLENITETLQNSEF